MSIKNWSLKYETWIEFPDTNIYQNYTYIHYLG